MFEIVSERLVVRPWQAGDREQRNRLMELAGNPEMMKYINSGKTWTASDVDDFLNRQRANLETVGVCIGSVHRREGGPLVGIGGLQPLGTEGRIQAAWWIAPEMQGRGYATELATAVIRCGFERLGLEEVLAVAYPGNIASMRVMEKAGMQPVGDFMANRLDARFPALPCHLYAAKAPKSGLT